MSTIFLSALAKRIELDTMVSKYGALLLLRRTEIVGVTKGLEQADPALVVIARESIA